MSMCTELLLYCADTGKSHALMMRVPATLDFKRGGANTNDCAEKELAAAKKTQKVVKKRCVAAWHRR
jgi:hypothetical protein